MSRPQGFTALCWLGVAILYVAVRVGIVDAPLDRDEGIFGLIGQAILRGEIPYRDVFDHKPPGVFYIYALALSFVPASARGIHVFLHLWNFATLLCVAGIARALWGSRAALWAALAYAFVSAAPAVQGFTASSELLLLLPLSASVGLVVGAARAEHRRRVVLLAAAGICAAFACWTKQSAAVVLLVVPAFILVTDASERRWARDLGALLAGGLGASAVVVLPFVLGGDAAELWYWSFTHSALYTSWSWSNAALGYWLQEFGGGLRDLFLASSVVCSAALAGCVLGVRDRGEARSGWFVPAFLLLSLLSVAQSGFFYTHYYAQLLPALALAAGFALARAHEALMTTPRNAWSRAAPAVAIVAVAASAGVTAQPDAVMASAQVLGSQGFEAGADVARYLRTRTSPDQSILIYGSEPQILLQAERRSANPFGMAYPLTGPFPRQREFQERVWAEVERQRPAYVLLPTMPESLLKTPEMDPWLEHKLAELIGEHYTLAALLVFDEQSRLTIANISNAQHASDLRPRTLIEIYRDRSL